MRTKNSMFNMAAAFGSQIITVLLGFISRTVFITALGAEYLGVNGLFTNILSIISLAESGIGSSIVYSLYKPVAENDEEKILILMNVYRKAFKVTGLIVFTIGITQKRKFREKSFHITEISHTNIRKVRFVIITCK